MPSLIVPAFGEALNYTKADSEPTNINDNVAGVIPFFGDTSADNPEPVYGDRPLPMVVKGNVSPATIATPIKTNVAASLLSQLVYGQNSQRIKARLWLDPAGTAGGELIASYGGAATTTNGSFPIFPGQIWDVEPEDAGMSLHVIWRTSALGVLRVTETV